MTDSYSKAMLEAAETNKSMNDANKTYWQNKNTNDTDENDSSAVANHYAVEDSSNAAAANQHEGYDDQDHPDADGAYASVV